MAIREKALGPEHPDTAMSFDNLAYLLQVQGDFAGARLLFERALAIFEKALGPEHPNTNLARRDLASLRLAEGSPAEALALSQAALAAYDKVLGASHPWTKNSAAVTADALERPRPRRRGGGFADAIPDRPRSDITGQRNRGWRGRSAKPTVLDR